MGSRANKPDRLKPPTTYVRKTTVAQDIKEIGERAGRLYGKDIKPVKDLRERKSRLDKAIEDAGG